LDGPNIGLHLHGHALGSGGGVQRYLVHLTSVPDDIFISSRCFKHLYLGAGNYGLNSSQTTTILGRIRSPIERSYLHLPAHVA
jgi:hypothetical protein